MYIHVHAHTDSLTTAPWIDQQLEMYVSGEDAGERPLGIGLDLGLGADYMHRPQSRDIGTPSRPRYVTYSCVDPLGLMLTVAGSSGSRKRTGSRFSVSSFSMALSSDVRPPTS